MLEIKDRDRLACDLHSILKTTPGLTRKELRIRLDKKKWPEILKKDMNSVLYGTRTVFDHSNDTPPRWYVIDSPPIEPDEAEPDLPPPLLGFYKGPKPRAWQNEAFNKWRQAGHRGVIEAVTGTGKTTVGILAAADAIVRGLRVLVIVPTIELLDQWYHKLNKDLRHLQIGRFGDSWKDTLHNCHIVVSTVHSAYRQNILPKGMSGLLIADEVHHYGAKMFALALRACYKERLGLTATFERDDNGIADILAPYFMPTTRHADTPVVGRCDYRRGLRDSILAPFRVVLVGVDLTSQEQERYDEFSSRLSRYKRRLIHFGCPEEPFGEFMRAVSTLSEGNNPNPEATRSAQRYLNAFTKRRALLAETTAKLNTLERLSLTLNKSKCALVFTETIDGASLAVARLVKHEINAYPYTSDMDRDTRKAVIENFRLGNISVLVAPRLLDEGIDLPAADLGVIVAASRSRRQMIQRMGRIIRPKSDGRPATFIILYVRNTFEDPAQGAHEAFLDEMRDNALEWGG